MSPMLISMLVFLGVAGVVGLLAFVFREQGGQTATRLDMLVGKRSRQDQQSADILRKTAFESDKKSLVEALTPKFLSPKKLFEQADCHIKPNTLMGIGLLLSVLAATGTILAKLPIWLGRGYWRFALPKLKHYGLLSMLHEARTDFSMLLGLIFLLLVGAGSWSLDARLRRR